MTQEDRIRTVQLMSLCHQLYPESKADPETVALYVPILEDLNYEIIKLAMFQLLRTSRFFPKPVEIIEAAETIQAALMKRTLPTSGEAWEEAIDCIKHNGSQKPYPFSCPEVKMAVKRFGYTALLELKTDDVNTARAQFMRIYQQCIETEKIKKNMANLIKRFGDEKIKKLMGTLAENKQLPQGTDKDREKKNKVPKDKLLQ